MSQPRIVQELVCLSKAHRPDVIFFLKLEKIKIYVESLHYRLRMKNVFTDFVQGKGEGLVWDGQYSLELNKYEEHFIHMYICNRDGTI